MLYFYLWCFFLICVILAVPLASFYEKRKLPPLRPMDPDEFEDDAPVEGDAFSDDAGDVEGAEPLEAVEQDAFGAGGDDAFGEEAFEEFQ